MMSIKRAISPANPRRTYRVLAALFAGLGGAFCLSGPSMADDVAPSLYGVFDSVGTTIYTPNYSFSESDPGQMSTGQEVTTDHYSIDTSVSLESHQIKVSAVTDTEADLSGQVYWWDTLFITVPGASSTTVTQIPAQVYADGTMSDISHLQIGFLFGSAAVPYSQGEALNALNYDPESNISFGGGGSWGGGPESGTPVWPGTFSANGSFSVYGASAIVPVWVGVGNFGAGDGGTVKFGDTVGLSITVPSGVTITTASGAPLPEPSSAALIATGAMCLAAARAKYGRLRQRLKM